jgi:hypothetical protein
MSKANTFNGKVGCGRSVLSRERFSKISAVEGLVMPKSMRGDFQVLDRRTRLPASGAKRFPANAGNSKFKPLPSLVSR